MSLEKNCKWHFSKQPNASQDVGPNNAAAEHFSATPYPSLIRESIQNSLDVVHNSSQPVIMKYSFGKIRSRSYENFFELKDHINGVLRMFGNKAKAEYEPMIAKLEEANGPQNELTYIKVSDSNTKGMNYRPDDTESTFYAFVRSIGVTVKSDASSGGSFGFGKSAYFMMSPIHTVLVSTRTIDQKTYFEGAATLCTHYYTGDDGIETKYQHYGYYDNNNGEGPISNPENIPSKFLREEVGTDIYIVGVDGSERAKIIAISEMIESTLRNFWMAIYERKLIVEIEDYIINHETLDLYMERCFPETLDKVRSGEMYNPRPYYEAVKRSGETKNFIRIRKTLPNLGNVELYIHKNKDARDGVIHLRKQRMFIFRARHYSSSYGYYAVFVCTDPYGNKLLQSIEDPSHRKWESGRNRQYGNVITKELKDFIDEALQEVFVSSNKGPLGITGLEEYLFVPEELIASDNDDIEDNPFFGDPSGNDQEEGASPTSRISDTEPTKETERKESIGKVVIVTPPTSGSANSEGSLGGHKRTTNKARKIKNKGQNPDKYGFEENEDETTGEFLQNIPVRYRVMAERKNGKMVHSIVIHTEFDVARGEIEIVVGGEENDENMNIVYTSMGTASNNRITNISLNKDISNTIEVRFEDEMKHAIKLTAYEFK